MAFIIKEIPIDANDGNQEFEMTLVGITYRFTLTYNSRLDLWALDIRTPQGVDIITGILLVAGTDLLAQYSLIEKPQGNLYCFNFADHSLNPTETTIGATASLLFRYEE